MMRDTLCSRGAHDALVVVSPMGLGDESKDEDRACWHAPGQTASVADGVTSSPFGGEAAELATMFGRILFRGCVEDHLRVLCDLLMARRADALVRGVTPPPGTPAR